MKISVSYEESDVAKALSKIITHSNKEEFIKLLTPMICSSNSAVDYFFKLMIDGTLPEVIPAGTLCRMKIEHLGYGSNKDEIRKKFPDPDDKIVVTIVEFRGYHEYSSYHVHYCNVLPDGSTKQESAYISMKHLEIIEEF